jgi:hypothetical protein
MFVTLFKIIISPIVGNVNVERITRIVILNF